MTYGIVVFGVVAAGAVEQSLVGLWWQATGITKRGGHDICMMEMSGVNRSEDNKMMKLAANTPAIFTTSTNRA